jgi:hypothetical protein
MFTIIELLDDIEKNDILFAAQFKAIPRQIGKQRRRHISNHVSSKQQQQQQMYHMHQ